MVATSRIEKIYIPKRWSVFSKPLPGRLIRKRPRRVHCCPRAQLLPLTGRVYEGNPGSEKSGIDRDKSTFKPGALEVVECTAGYLVFGQRDHHRGAVEDWDPVLDSHMPQRERLGPDAHH